MCLLLSMENCEWSIPGIEISTFTMVEPIPKPSCSIIPHGATISSLRARRYFKKFGIGSSTLCVEEGSSHHNGSHGDAQFGNNELKVAQQRISTSILLLACSFVCVGMFLDIPQPYRPFAYDLIGKYS